MHSKRIVHYRPQDGSFDCVDGFDLPEKTKQLIVELFNNEFEERGEPFYTKEENKQLGIVWLTWDRKAYPIEHSFEVWSTAEKAEQAGRTDPEQFYIDADEPRRKRPFQPHEGTSVFIDGKDIFRCRTAIYIPSKNDYIVIEHDQQPPNKVSNRTSAWLQKVWTDGYRDHQTDS